MTKAGLSVRRKGRKASTAQVLTFCQLAQAAGRGCAPFAWRDAAGVDWGFELGLDGLVVSRPGRRPRVVPFRELANLGKAQPELFTA